MAINPFYVHPGADIGLGLRGLGEQIENRAQVAMQRVKMQKQQEQLNIAGQMMKSGDMQGLSEIILKNPAIGDQITASMNFKNTATKENASETAFKILSGENPQQVLTDRVDFLTRSGGDPSGTIKLLQSGTPDEINKMAEMTLMSADPKLYKTWKESTIGGIATLDVASIKEMEYLTQGLTPEEKQKAKRVKLGLTPRASEAAVDKASKAYSVEVARLQAKLGLEPQVAGAVAAAKNQASVESDIAVEDRSNKKAWNVYSNAMDNFAQAMSGTITGPFVGFIPAITANAQIADGAIAVMAPVLKDVFRSAGEGTFTKDDQEVLMEMLPTRKDKPKARVAKIKAVDALVRAKLGIDDEGLGAPPVTGDKETTPPPSNLSAMTDEELAAQIRALQGGQ